MVLMHCVGYGFNKIPVGASVNIESFSDFDIPWLVWQQIYVTFLFIKNGKFYQSRYKEKAIRCMWQANRTLRVRNLGIAIANNKFKRTIYFGAKELYHLNLLALLFSKYKLNLSKFCLPVKFLVFPWRNSAFPSNFCFLFVPVLRATAERKGREVMTSIVLPSFDWLTSELDPKNGGQFQGHVWEHNKAVALARIPLCDMPPKQCLRFSG